MRRNTRFRYPGGRRAVWGALAYAVGWVVAYVVVLGRVDRLLSAVTVPGTAGGEPATLASVLPGTPPAWQVSTLAFYNAHLASAFVETPAGVLRRNLVTAAGGTTLVLIAVPPAVLTTAGVLATRHADDAADLRFDLWGTGWQRFAVDGGLVPMLGYVPLAFLGSGVATIRYADGQVSLDPLGAWVLVALLYPLVFGGLGGALVWYAKGRP